MVETNTDKTIFVPNKPEKTSPASGSPDLSDAGNVIEVRGLTKKFDRRIVVDGVTFKINPGEIVGYLGPNGAGKSTTVKMLVGILRPTRANGLQSLL